MALAARGPMWHWRRALLRRRGLGVGAATPGQPPPCTGGSASTTRGRRSPWCTERLPASLAVGLFMQDGNGGQWEVTAGGKFAALSLQQPDVSTDSEGIASVGAQHLGAGGGDGVHTGGDGGRLVPGWGDRRLFPQRGPASARRATTANHRRLAAAARRHCTSSTWRSSLCSGCTVALNCVVQAGCAFLGGTREGLGFTLEVHGLWSHLPLGFKQHCMCVCIYVYIHARAYTLYISVICSRIIYMYMYTCVDVYLYVYAYAYA